MNLQTHTMKPFVPTVPLVPSRERMVFDRALTACTEELPNQRGILYRTATDDERLIHLTRLLHAIGRDAQVNVHGIGEDRTEALAALRHHLARVTAFVIAWLRARNEECVLELIFTERIRQRTLFLSRRLPFECSSPVVDPRRKFRVLLEELGEVAKAVDAAEHRPTEQAQFEVRVELVQVAAVACAWLEAL